MPPRLGDLFIFSLFYVSGLAAMYVGAPSVYSAHRETSSLGAGVTDGCKSPCGVGNQTQVLCKSGGCC